MGKTLANWKTFLVLSVWHKWFLPPLPLPPPPCSLMLLRENKVGDEIAEAWGPYGDGSQRLICPLALSWFVHGEVMGQVQKTVL